MLLDIIKIKNELNSKASELKLKAEQKEIVKYYAWKGEEENSKSRDSLEKVIAKLKMEDLEWLNQDMELVQVTNLSKTVNNIYEVLVNLTKRNDINLENIMAIEKDYIQKFGLGEYL